MNTTLTNALGAAVRQVAEQYHSEADESAEMAPTMAQREVYELQLCLARAIERSGLSGRQIHEFMGAPGDWGYSTPIGKALQAIYKHVG